MSLEIISIFGEPNISFQLQSVVEETDFICHQPEFINGLYEGSSYVYIDASELPDGLRIYLNVGPANNPDFGTVKNHKCFVKLSEPLRKGQIIFCYINTEYCNVQSCEYEVGELISGEVGCINALEVPQNGTLTGGFICFQTDLHREEYNEYGQKVIGDTIQEDCYLCGGIEPSCE